MCYILAVNPAVMAGAGFDSLHSAAATSICGMVATLGLSIVVNVPFGAAPGMGLNTIFAYELIRQNHLSREQALAVSFAAGLLFVILACMGWCGRILNWTPLSLKKAMVVSIGLFQTLVGFYSTDFIAEGQFSILQFQGFSDPKQLVAIFTLVLTATLVLFEVPSSIFFGVLASVAVAAITGLTTLPVSELSTVQGAVGQFFNPPVSVLTMPSFDFSIFSSSTGWASLAFLFIVVFVDTAGVMVGVAAQGEGLLDKRTGRVIGDRGCYVILGFGVMLSALMGTSPIIIFLESAAAVNMGGRTGVTSLVCAMCFGLSSFFAPAIRFIPQAASSAILILVGSFMSGAVLAIPWDRINESLPAYITIAVTVFTCSVSHGLAAGFIFYFFLNISFGISKVTGWTWLEQRLSYVEESYHETPLHLRTELEREFELRRPSRSLMMTSMHEHMSNECAAHDEISDENAVGRARAALSLIHRFAGNKAAIQQVAGAITVADTRGVEGFFTDLSAATNPEEDFKNLASVERLTLKKLTGAAGVGTPNSRTTTAAPSAQGGAGQRNVAKGTPQRQSLERSRQPNNRSAEADLERGIEINTERSVSLRSSQPSSGRTSSTVRSFADESDDDSGVRNTPV
eukprot:Selendium_serpulae@DN3899_c0_g1_i1.p1